jgi:hypothetical protein
MTTSPAHIKAQHRISTLLEDHYDIVIIEHSMPTPNPKYVYDGEEFIIKPYDLDVYATALKYNCLCKYATLGIEIDGKVGHKTSKHQTIRDTQRTKSLEQQYPHMTMKRFDTKQLVGRGYVNPKTKKRHKILTDYEIWAELGVFCTHV